MPRYRLFGVQLDCDRALHTLVAYDGHEPSDRGGAGDPAKRSAAEEVLRLRAQPPAHSGAAEPERWQERYTLTFADHDDVPFMTVLQERNPHGHDTDGHGAEGHGAHRHPHQLGGRHLLRVHDRAEFEVSADGREITCRPVAGVPWLTVEQLLVDQIIPRVMQLWGRPCLHASAVADQDGAVAFIGAAGSGKSTLSAALCERGRPLLCDDCLALQAEGANIWVHPGYASVRLWPDSAQALLGNDHQLPLASPRTDKLRKAYPLPQRRTRLRCLIVLAPHETGPVTRLRMRPREGFAAMLSALHRLTPQGAAVLGAEFALLSAVAEHTPIWRVGYEQRYNVLDELVEAALSCARSGDHAA